MADETTSGETELTPPSRREVVTKAAQVAVTAPAVAVLLNASARNAFAQLSPYQSTLNHVLDDFLSGNNHEDIDAISLGSNAAGTSGFAQDDHI